MVDAKTASFEKPREALGVIDVNVPFVVPQLSIAPPFARSLAVLPLDTGVFFRSVIDAGVSAEVPTDDREGLVSVGHQVRFRLHNRLDDRGQLRGGLPGDNAGSNPPLPGVHNDYDRLVRPLAARVPHVFGVSVFARLAADSFRVDLDLAVENRFAFVPVIEKFSNSVCHFPGRRLSHAEMPGQNDGRDALAAAEQVEQRLYPLEKGEFCPVKRREGLDGELGGAVSTLEQPDTRGAGFSATGRFDRVEAVDLDGFAMRAERTVRPDQGFEEGSCLHLVCETSGQLVSIGVDAEVKVLADFVEALVAHGRPPPRPTLYRKTHPI